MTLFDLALVLAIVAAAHATTYAIGYHYGAKNQRRMSDESRRALDALNSHMRAALTQQAPFLPGGVIQKDEEAVFVVKPNESPPGFECVDDSGHHFTPWRGIDTQQCMRCGATGDTRNQV